MSLVNRLRLVVAALLSLALVACQGDEGPTNGEQLDDLAGAIIVSAAASLTDVFTELGETFEAQHEGVTIEFNFGSSSALATQIVEGAPAAVFASANHAQMQVVVDAGMANDPQVFAQNRIVVIAPSESDVVQEFADIASDGVRLVLAGAEVPVGDYALIAIAAADRADPGFGDAALANLVSEEANVRAVLTKVELGEADAGIVYETDAAISGDAVRVAPIPDEYVSPATYPIATLGDSPSSVAEAFVAYVLSAEGQAILQRYGFTAP